MAVTETKDQPVRYFVVQAYPNGAVGMYDVTESADVQRALHAADKPDDCKVYEGADADAALSALGAKIAETKK